MRKRLTALDAFRGITIAAMIIVNNPGSWRYVYPLLRHAGWHGWTPTDLIFPFFLFIVGVSLSFSLSRRIDEKGVGPSLYLKIIRRSVLLFLLGLLLNFIPNFDLSNLRVPGVLQRIAICYFLAAWLYLKSSRKFQLGIAVFILIGYWALLKFVPVPGYGPNALGPETNLCGYLDTKLLAGHLYTPNFDPEGLLSTFPALVTTLLGVFTGDWLRSSSFSPVKKKGLTPLYMALAGLVLVGIGLALNPIFPINKNLWTSTFVIFTGGMALIVLSLAFFVIEIAGLKKWAYPFLVFGTNPITVYVGSSLLAKLLGRIHVFSGEQIISVKGFIFQKMLSPWAGNYLGSLLFPIILLAFWLGVLLPLYRKNIFIRV